MRTLFGSNAYKFGLFGANCAGGMTLSAAPERWPCRDSIRVRGGPRGTPSEIVDKLNAEINRGLADPKIKQRFAEMGVLILSGSPEDFGKMLADETEKWGKAVKFANVSAIDRPGEAKLCPTLCPPLRFAEGNASLGVSNLGVSNQD